MEELRQLKSDYRRSGGGEWDALEGDIEALEQREKAELQELRVIPKEGRGARRERSPMASLSIGCIRLWLPKSTPEVQFLHDQYGPDWTERTRTPRIFHGRMRP